MQEAKLSRRSFLKSAALAAAVVATADGFAGNLGAVDPARADEAEAEETVLHTSCRACICDCGVIATVRNGKVVSIKGDPEDPISKGRLCAKGLAGIQALYNPNRLKYPMRRVGERGENKWERISWETAIDTIADAMWEMYQKDDPMQLMLSCGGGGNPTRIMMPPRFLNAWGGGNFFEPGCAQCYLPRSNGMPVVNGLNDTSIADGTVTEIYFGTSKSAVLWGCGPAQSYVAGGGRAVAECRARGMKTVVVDPRFTPDASKADVWLPVRPGTDVALMLTWIRYIMANDLYDHEFCLKWTNLPYLVNEETKLTYRASELGIGGDDEYVVWDRKTDAPKAMPFPWDDKLDPVLDGEFEIDGKKSRTAWRALWDRVEPWTIEKGAEVCWLEPDKIVEAIKIYTDGAPASGIGLGVPTDQYIGASDGPMGAAILDILTGCIEQKGSWIQKRPGGGPAGIAQPWDSGGFNEKVPTLCVPADQQAQKLGYIEHKGLEHWHASHIPSVLKAVATGKPYQPRIWIDFSGNKPIMMGNAGGFIEDMRQNMELIVHCYMYPTTMSVELADIILPTSEWLECAYIAYRLNKVVVRQPCVNLYEAIDNHMIYSWIGKALADRGHENFQLCFSENFPDDNYGGFWKTYDEYKEWLAHQADIKALKKGLTWDELRNQAPIRFMDDEQWETGYYEAYKKIDEKTGLPAGVNTNSKKCEPYAEGFTIMGRTGGKFGHDHCGHVQPPASVDYDPLPQYFEPAESPLTDEEYPLVLTSGRVPMYHHGTLRNVPYLREIYPVPQCWINSVTAAEYGLQTGDWARIESRRGSTHGKVVVTEAVAPGVVFQERFWNPELLTSDDPSQAWKAMNVNVLTKNDPPYNTVYGSYTLRGFTVRISKSAKPEGAWEEPEEFESWMPEYTENTGGGYAVYDAGEANYA